MKYKVIKIVEAKNMQEALKKEQSISPDEIYKEEENEKVGF